MVSSDNRSIRHTEPASYRHALRRKGSIYELLPYLDDS